MRREALQQFYTAATKRVFCFFANRGFLERLYTFDSDVLWSSVDDIYMFALANHSFKFYSKYRKNQSLFVAAFLIVGLQADTQPIAA